MLVYAPCVRVAIKQLISMLKNLICMGGTKFWGGTIWAHGGFYGLDLYRSQ